MLVVALKICGENGISDIMIVPGMCCVVGNALETSHLVLQLYEIELPQI